VLPAAARLALVSPSSPAVLDRPAAVMLLLPNMTEAAQKAVVSHFMFCLQVAVCLF
jgi:hypothetical protein